VQDNNTEEKTLPASQKKLRDARQKGRVSSSRDLISGFGLLAMLVYLLMMWPTIRDHILELIDLVPTLLTEPFEVAWPRGISVALNIIWVTIAPAIAVLVVVTVVTGMAATFGPVFSFEPVKPNMEHINPAAGLKRIFSMRSVVEFGKSLFKVALLGSVLFLVLRFWLRAMFHAPHCGQGCVVPLLLAAAKPIIAVAAFSFIVIGLVDIGVQRWLFLRDMRMTKTEQKRERKDIEGDPLILSARRRERQSQGNAPRLGLAAASLIIVGDDHIAGVQYSRKKMPVPLIVVRSQGEGVKALREAAAQLNIPAAEDPALAAKIVAQHRPGDYLRPEHFPIVARLLIQMGLVQ
jgi:type III secretion protein U